MNRKQAQFLQAKLLAPAVQLSRSECHARLEALMNEALSQARTNVNLRRGSTSATINGNEVFVECTVRGFTFKLNGERIARANVLDFISR